MHFIIAGIRIISMLNMGLKVVRKAGRADLGNVSLEKTG